MVRFTIITILLLIITSGIVGLLKMKAKEFPFLLLGVGIVLLVLYFLPIGQDIINSIENPSGLAKIK